MNVAADQLVCPICTGPKLEDEPECAYCRDGPDAYQAVKETDACLRCGEGESWTVKGPDGVCIGQSWEGDEAECDAEETAQMLNAAYAQAEGDLAPKLVNVAIWLENGCDPKHAAKELRLLAGVK